VRIQLLLSRWVRLGPHVAAGARPGIDLTFRFLAQDLRLLW
jgi:hypothetical protein